MTEGTRIADLDEVPERGSYLFTARDRHAAETEIVLVRCGADPGVVARLNVCPHEAQRLDTGDGAATRDGEIVCPRHGSLFDARTGACDNGPAAGTTLPEVSVAVEDGAVLLTDDDYTFLHAGAREADSGPGSTSHLGF